MSKETKALLILDEYEEKKKEIDKIYNDNYATEEMTAESTLALNMWHTEELGKLESWLIATLKKVFEEAK